MTVIAANADAVQLRAALRALATELVTVGAVLLEHLGPRNGVGTRGAETFAAAAEQLLQLLVGRR